MNGVGGSSPNPVLEPGGTAASADHYGSWHLNVVAIPKKARQGERKAR